MSGLIEIVEELGGTVVLGGTLIQFSDDAFKKAFKDIYDAGAAAEREACIKAIKDVDDYQSPAYPECIQAIQARGQE